MHVIDVVLDSFSNLFRSHRYSPLEKIYSVILFTAGLSLRDLSERLSLTGASRESVRIWVHRFSSLFSPSRRVRRLVAVDETVLKVNGQICYLWAAIDVDTNEILAVYASKGRGIPSAVKFLRKVLDSCEGKPVIVVDRGPWYRWALDRLGIIYFHETFGNRNRIERWFREMKERTKRFYNNVNAKTLKSLEELVTAIAIMHNIIRAGGEEVIPTCQYREIAMKTLNDISVSLGVITIPCRFNLLKKLLKSIFTGSQLPDELIIVINGCSNNSIISSYIEFIKSVSSQRNYSNIKLICLDEDVPVGYCRSLIIRYSSSDYIAMIDDDVILHPLWMEKMKYSLQFKPDIVAGRVEPDLNLPYEIVKFLREKAYYNEFASTLNYKFMKIKGSISKGIFLIDGIRGVWSNNMVIKRELIERIGNFRIILGYYKDDVGGEDTEFKMRARKSDAIFLYNSNAVVYHAINPERLTFSYIFKRSWHHGLLYSCIFPPMQLIKAFIGEFFSIFYYFLIDRRKECFLAITRFISLLSALLSLKKREDFVERRLLAIRKAKYKIITV